MGGGDLAALRDTLVALAAVLVGRAAVAWTQEAVARRCSAAVKSSLRMRLLRHVARSPGVVGGAASAGGGDASPSSGEVVALATRGLDALDAYFAHYLPQLVLAGIVPVAVILCLAKADLVAALTVALTVPLIPLFMVLIGSATERRRQRRSASFYRRLFPLSAHR